MSDVKMPQLGETVADGTVAKWFKRIGDEIVKGEPLFEVSTDKVDTEIPAQSNGVLTAILVHEGETVDVGTVLAVISSEADVQTGSSSMTTSAARPDVASDRKAPNTDLTPSLDRGQLSPVVRKLLQERGLDAREILGTGPGGRITKEDVRKYVAPTVAPKTANTQSPVVRRLLEEHGIDASAITPNEAHGRLSRREVEEFISKSSAPTSGTDDEVIPFTRIRRLTANHMVTSKATSAHTLMVREVDYESVERIRRTERAAFKDREGFSLTYLPFNAFATVLALREFPHLNASVGENELIIHRRINLGIAVDLSNEGLVVPVVKSAEERGVLGLARIINEKARGARNAELGVDDYTEGTFTITNPGPFGTLMTGAIINQPQVAILSTDAVSRRPVVVTGTRGEESIAIHSTGLLALTFDHRAVDGAYAARFLQRIGEILFNYEWSDDF